jgi:hypothetical protein
MLVMVFVEVDGGAVTVSTRQERSIPPRAPGKHDHNSKLCARKPLTTVVFNSIGMLGRVLSRTSSG